MNSCYDVETSQNIEGQLIMRLWHFLAMYAKALLQAFPPPSPPPFRPISPLSTSACPPRLSDMSSVSSLCVCPADARGVVIDPEKYTVHDVTGTLKQFLHSLPDPVLTQSLYQNFIATIRKSN